uniref:CSON008849 protein n=1 Tax=Culicoides sonorensis TaxID=179676 RepID=A0A336LZB7_CULSO
MSTDICNETAEIHEKYLTLVEKVNTAKNEKKIYRFVGCNFKKIKSELRKRGFIEKRKFRLGSIYYQMPLSLLLNHYEENSKCEQALMSRMIGNCNLGLVWIWNPRLYDKFIDVPLLNKIKIVGSNFGLKNGLGQCVNKINWNFDDKTATVNYPRSYSVIDNEEIEDFLIDYKLSLACSIVIFLHTRSNIRSWFSKSKGMIYYGGIELALDIVNFFTKKAEGLLSDPDFEISDKSLLKLERLHNNLVNNHFKILAGSDRALQIISKIKYAYSEIKHYWPSRITIDGFHNIWLLKPSFVGQGWGIILSNNIDRITKQIEKRNKRYIVQKYIEKPLLIHKTKFDLRTYYMITISQTHLCAWTHKLSTVKFAAHEFTFTNLNKAVHVTNTSVNRKIKKIHENPLPENHMWSIDDLIAYFKEIGKENIWEEQIYPSMQSSLVAVTLASIDNIELKPGRFELFGCDYLITEDFQMFLLEINRGPSMCYYTPISKYVCGTVMEDVVKVAIDLQSNPKADTGGWDKIYEMKLPEKKVS